jgi:hypothetical protein
MHPRNEPDEVQDFIALVASMGTNVVNLMRDIIVCKSIG